MGERLERAINNVIERDKIQLSEIKKKRFKDYTLGDYVFLHEQAERVEWFEKELEHQAKHFDISYDVLEGEKKLVESENQRYKQALEFASSELYQAYITGDISDKENRIKEVMEKVDEVLEGGK